jgi:predicted exporter
LLPIKKAFFSPLAVWLLAMLAGVVVIMNSHFVADMSAFLPRNPTKQQQILVDQLTRGPLSRTLLIGIDGGSLEQRIALSRAFVASAKQSQAFDVMSNGESQAEGQEAALLMQYRYVLSSEVNAERFSEQGLRQAITQTVLDLSSSMGGTLKQILPRDPTGELLVLMSDFDATNRPQRVEGVWFSKAGERAILLAQFKADGADTDAQEQLLVDMRQQFDQLKQAQGSADCGLLIAGSAVYAVDARHKIKSEVSKLSMLGMCGVIALLFLVFRSMASLGMCILPVFSATLIGTAVVSLVFGTVHGITVGFGSTLIGEAVDYSIYYMIQSQAVPAAGSPCIACGKTWLKQFWPTIRLGVLTSICGFACLIFSGFPGLAQLGVFSIAGLVSAALATRFVLPEFSPQLKPLVVGHRLLSGLRRALRIIQALPKAFGLLAVLALVFLALKQGHIWNPSLSGLSPIPTEAQRLDEVLRADLGAPQMRYLVVVEAAEQETVLRGAEAASARLRDLQTQQVIAGFESPSRLLPSKYTQQQRLAALPESDVLMARLRPALVGLPLQPERLNPFVADVAQAKAQPLLTRESFGRSDLAMSFDALMMQTERGLTAFLPIRQTALLSSAQVAGDAEVKQVVLLTRRLNQLATEAQTELVKQGLSDVKISFIDLAEESALVYTKYFDEILLLSMVGYCLICALLYFTLKNWRSTLAVLFPLLLAVIFVMAALVSLGERLTLLHLVGLLLIVALGSNYALFFNFSTAATEQVSGKARVEAKIDATTLASLLLASASTMIGFGVLSFSSVPVLHALGVTVAPGAIAALFLSVAFAPPLTITERQA